VEIFVYSLDDQHLFVVDVYSLVNIVVVVVDYVKEIDHTYGVFLLEILLIVEEQESSVLEVDEDFDAWLNYTLEDTVQ
jgi:hypothetical protein